MLPLVFSLVLATDFSGTQPQLASDGKTTALVYGSHDSIYFAQPDSTPVKVADTPVLALGNHRGPRIAIAASAIVVTATVAPVGRQYEPGTLRSWRSIDRGAAWTPGPDVSTPGTGGMGFHSIASDGGNRIWAAWIGPESGHPILYASHSEDAGATWVKQRLLSPTVCECCHPTVALSADGTIWILFRNNLGGNRDFYLATSRDGEKFDFVKLGQGSWKLEACPMDGGGMSLLDGQIVTLWRRQSQIYLARSDGQPEESFAVGHNPAITVRKEGLYAVWQDGEKIMAKSPGRDPWPLAKSGMFPVLSPTGPVLAAWEDQGKIRTALLLY